MNFSRKVSLDAKSGGMDEKVLFPLSDYLIYNMGRMSC